MISQPNTTAPTFALKASFVALIVAINLICTSSTLAQKPDILINDGDTIAFLGDSITAGGASYGGYCRLVVQGLKTKGINVTPICAGVPGNTSADMLLRLDRDVLDRKPDHVFIAAGVNDIWHHEPTVKIGVFQAKPGMGVGLEHYRGYMKQIIDRCEAAGAGVILSTITPITEDPQFKLNKTSEKYNAFLRSLAAERKLPLAELGEAMFAQIALIKSQPQDSGHRRNMVTSDGVHPIPVGHQVMAKGILKAMGFSKSEVTLAEAEWKRSPSMLIFGDRQLSAGSRTGGWCHLLMDGLNIGRDMVTFKPVKKDTVNQILSALESSIEEDRTRYLLIQAPNGDIHGGTPLDAYRATVSTIIDRAREKQLQVVIATIPLLDNDPDSDANKGINTYSNLLREACKEKQATLVDINAAMRDYYEKNAGARLTIGDERFNHKGGTLMAEVAFKAFGGNEELLPQLETIWDERPSYTFLYGGSANVDIRLSTDGHRELKEIADRYHSIGARRILDLGIYMLLRSDQAENQQRIDYFNRNWTTTLTAENEIPYQLSARLMPSAKYRRTLEAYMKQEGIDLSELCRRAFKVGVYAMRNEDLLGRGAY